MTIFGRNIRQCRRQTDGTTNRECSEPSPVVINKYLIVERSRQVASWKYRQVPRLRMSLISNDLPRVPARRKYFSFSRQLWRSAWTLFDIYRARTHHGFFSKIIGFFLKRLRLQTDTMATRTDINIGRYASLSIGACRRIVLPECTRIYTRNNIR